MDLDRGALNGDGKNLLKLIQLSNVVFHKYQKGLKQVVQ
jgi:hypothetical protein